jgi:hypothetical protein
MACEGCEPTPSNLQPPPIVNVRGPGVAETKTAGLPNPNPQLVDIFNAINSLRIDMMTVQHVLLARGLVTEQEMMSAKIHVVAMTQKAFEEAKKQLGRDFHQKPVNYKPTDPRGGHDTWRVGLLAVVREKKAPPTHFYMLFPISH